MIKLKKIYQCLINPKFFKSYLYRSAPLFELSPIIKKLENPEILIDIGSNKGQFSLLIKNFFPNIRIYSFEPIKEELEIQKKILSSSKNIKYHNIALGNKNKKIYLNITSRKDSSSILTPIVKNDNQYKEIEKRSIKLKRLDDIIDGKLIKQPIVMKLDVQGYELEVLRGSRDLLNYISYIILEISYQKMYENQCSVKKLFDFLNYNNFYELKRCNLSYRNGNKFQADVLFVKK